MIDKLLRTGFCLLVVTSLLLAGGCGPHKVTVGQGDSVVTLRTGDILVVVLPVNLSTGYTWQVLNINPAMLAQQGEPVYAPATGSGQRVGSGGTLTFRFEALQPGGTVLVLGYLRPWETTVGPLEVYGLEVEIE